MVEGLREITRNGAKFMDGQEKEFDSIILATGYKSNVPCWLKVMFVSMFVLCYISTTLRSLSLCYTFRPYKNLTCY